MAPTDPILGITEAFKNDKDPKKVNLGVGAYRDDNGKPWILPSVIKASKAVADKNLDHEYLPIQGLDSFIEGSLKLAYGKDSKPLKENRIAALQSLSGTGACRLATAYFKRFLPEGTAVFIPKPTWPNHKNIIEHSGLKWKEYRYYDSKTKGVDFKGLLEDLEAAPSGSVILLHVCAHNPTGADPTLDQWKQIKEVIKKKNLIPFFDSAYQGFTSGDCDRDAAPVRLFAEDGMNVILAQSFAKNMGLYGQRIGCFSIVCSDLNEKARVLSQAKMIARAMYSNPPLTGARIVDAVLNTPDLNTQWLGEVKSMAQRIADMRKALVEGLKKAGSPHNWKHITDQIGMFAYTGMTEEQVGKLASEHHIYLTKDGRISIAGLNSKNVDNVAKAFHEVTKDAKF